MKRWERIEKRFAASRYRRSSWELDMYGRRRYHRHHTYAFMVAHRAWAAEFGIVFAP